MLLAVQAEVTDALLHWDWGEEGPGEGEGLRKAVREEMT